MCTWSSLARKISTWVWTSNLKEVFDDTFLNILKIQKQPSRGVVRKRCSENMQQVYRRTPMPKCDFNSNFVEITLGHGCSLQICCIFFEQFFLETPLSNCFWNAKQINHIQRFSCSHQKVLCQKGALINFAKSTKTTCARVSLLIKLEV